MDGSRNDQPQLALGFGKILMKKGSVKLGGKGQQEGKESKEEGKIPFLGAGSHEDPL